MRKIPLIIDTDPGVDDAIAIMMALYSEELDVRLITTVTGNVNIDKVTNNALKILTFLNKKNVKVAKGCSIPLIEPLKDGSVIHGESGLAGFDFDEIDVELSKNHAVIEMKDIILNSKEKITIMPIGPLTNIAMLLRLYPEVKNNIERIVFMGGSIARGNKTVMAEFNISADPESAYIVINSGLKVEMLDLEIGRSALLYPEDSEKIKKINEVGEKIYSLLKVYKSGDFKTGLKMYDSTALSYILRPDLFKMKNVYVDVELEGKYSRGATVVDLDNTLNKKPNVNVALSIDEVGFKNFMFENIRKCKGRK